MRTQEGIGPATRPYQYFFRLVDITVLEFAYYLAYLTVPLVRSRVLPGDPSAFYAEVTFLTALLIPLVWLGVLQVRGLYGDPARMPYSFILSRVLQTTFVSLGIVALALFALKEGGLSRLLLFIFAIYSFPIIVMVRVFERWYFTAKHRVGHYSERLIVIGQGNDVQKIWSMVSDLDTLRDCQIVGYLDSGSADEGTQLNVPLLGKVEDLAREIVKREASEVLVVWDSRTMPELNSALDTCREMGLRVRAVPKFALDYSPFAPSILSTRPESFWGLPSIVISTISWNADQEFIKRLVDIVVSAVLLVLLSPLFLIIALAVRLSSPGSVLYEWKVLGRNNRKFVGYKFRTMVDNADNLKASLMAYNEMTGPVFKMRNDPRITPLGRWLRKFSLDELPQFWSVLRGDMSLVGPRPVFRAEYERFEFWQMRKLSVRPGITCLWQANGRNKIADVSKWIRMDLEYIDNWSLWLDFKILAKTVFVVLRGSGQ